GARVRWLSHRSGCYRAPGRPVLAQDTGFDGVLPVGDGLITFATEDEVIAGIETINADYPRHAKAARDLAVEYFDANRVLRRLLSAVCRWLFPCRLCGRSRTRSSYGRFSARTPRMHAHTRWSGCDAHRGNTRRVRRS